MVIASRAHVHNKTHSHACTSRVAIRLCIHASLHLKVVVGGYKHTHIHTGGECMQARAHRLHIHMLTWRPEREHVHSEVWVKLGAGAGQSLLLWGCVLW